MSTSLRRRARFSLIASSLVLGCNGKGPTGEEVTTGDAGTVIAGDGGGECGENAPAISAGPFCTYEGLGSAEPGLDEVPVLRISGVFTDADGDLHNRSTRIWYDGEPLGEIDYETADLKQRSFTTSGETPCEVFEVQDLGDKIYLQPNKFEYGVDMDWAISAGDAAANFSEPAVVTCKTPLEDGSEP